MLITGAYDLNTFCQLIPAVSLIEPVLNDRPAKAAARSALSTPTHDHCGICTDACPSCGDAWKLLLDSLS